MDLGCGNRWANPPHRRHAVEHRGFITGWIQPAALLCATALALSFCGSKSNEPEPVVIKQIWYTPAWSPDGREIACQLTRIDDSSNSTYFTAVVDAETGAIVRERPITGPPPFNFSWTPDGQWLLFGAGPGIFKMSAELNSVIQLTSGQFQTEPSVSGRRNLIFFTENDGVEGGLFSLTLDGDSLRRWSTAQTLVLGCSAFPDSSDSLVGFAVLGYPYPLIVFSPDSINSATFLGGGSEDPIARVSRDHRYVAYTAGVFPGSDCNLLLLDRADDSVSCVTMSTSRGMDFSPDGTKLVYPIQDGKEVGLWILDVATGGRTRLTDGTQ